MFEELGHFKPPTTISFFDSKLMVSKFKCERRQCHNHACDDVTLAIKQTVGIICVLKCNLIQVCATITWILHQTSVTQTPKQNGVVEGQNRTLVEAARTMQSAAKSRAYRVFNKRIRVIVETIHVNFDELPQMASDHISSDPSPQCQGMALEHDSLSPRLQYQENVTQPDRTVTTSNELDLLFSSMFDELLNGSSKFVSKSFDVTTADAANQCQQQQTTLLNNHITPESTFHDPTQAPTVTFTENMNQAEMVEENAQVTDDEFINIFCTPVQDRGETSSHHIDSLNMYTFYQ
nr:hypothetical protein [Tanacetum cinerariifolium]